MGFKTITLDRAGQFSQPARPRVHDDPAVKLTSYPGTVRQLIVTGLGRDQPAVIITNERQATTRNLIMRYARRMTIEQRLAEIIRAFCADALSSAVNLNVDLDVVFAVLAQALLAALRARLPGYHAVTPDVIQRRFLETPGRITTTADAITVRLERRAYSPVLRKASPPAERHPLARQQDLPLRACLNRAGPPARKPAFKGLVTRPEKITLRRREEAQDPRPARGHRNDLHLTRREVIASQA